MGEFNLSEKRKKLFKLLIEWNVHSGIQTKIINKIIYDDKEFIKRLKKEFPKVFKMNKEGRLLYFRTIDKLAGNRLAQALVRVR